MSYLDALRKYPYFTNTDEYSICYQNKENLDLIRIRQDYNLDIHFCGNNYLTKVVSLMNFVHDELFFVGENAKPEVMNTMEIMKIKKTGSVFCSCYSTVFSEMLLSLGVKAVRITCLPFSFDYDCHVGVMVYLQDINKWAYFDPTFNTYFFDQYSIPLDIFEIRNLYLTQKPVVFRHITIDKKWKLFMNGTEYPIYDEWYKAYMEKNIFRFLLPQESKYNYINKNSNYYILNPIEYTAKNEYDNITDESKIKYVVGNIFTK